MYVFRRKSDHDEMYEIVVLLFSFIKRSRTNTREHALHNNRFWEFSIHDQGRFGGLCNDLHATSSTNNWERKRLITMQLSLDCCGKN